MGARLGGGVVDDPAAEARLEAAGERDDALRVAGEHRGAASPIRLTAAGWTRAACGSQSDRYRALGDHVAASQREPQALTVRFDDDVDLDLLLETVEVERGCCTFFELAPDVQRRELVVSVADRERVPALDAIATAMGVS